MKRLLLVVVLVAACLLLFAAPASASFYNPQTDTAYIPHWSGGIDDTGFGFSLDGTVDPSDPYAGLMDNYGPISHDTNVVVTAEWFDTRLGATLVPAKWFHSFKIIGSALLQDSQPRGLGALLEPGLPVRSRQ